MAEQPIKLFTTHSDRYPQPDISDKAQGVARAAVAAIPLVGGSINELVSVVLAPSIERRRDTWLKELADSVEALKTRVHDFSIEGLNKNDAFVSATIQATRIAIGTHLKEKHEMLRAALLNIAHGKGPDDDPRQMYLNSIEVFSISHINVLKFLQAASAEINNRAIWDAKYPGTETVGEAIEFLHPEMKGQDDLLQAIITDLKNRGFSAVSRPSAAVPPANASSSVGPLITGMGIEFLTFISGSR
jgi:hypothetical protein